MRRFGVHAVRGIGGAVYWILGVYGVPNALAQTDAIASKPVDGISVEGFSAFDAGRYEEAGLKLERALELRGVPVLALFAARTNVQLGHWVRASEWYLLAMHQPNSTDSELARLQVEHEAKREREALLARMPRLTVGLDGQDLDDVVVTLDSEPMTRALFGACQFVDPGHHKVQASRGNQTISGEIDLLEGEHKTVTLRFARRTETNALEQTLPTLTTRNETIVARLPKGVGVATAPSPAPSLPYGNGASSPSPVRSMPMTNESTRNETQVAAGWVTLGLGVTSASVGLIAGVSLLSAHSDLAGDCVSNRCDSSRASDVERYNRLRNWSTVGLITGTVLVGTGLALVLTSSRKHDGPSVAFVVSSTSAAFVRDF